MAASATTASTINLHVLHSRVEFIFFCLYVIKKSMAFWHTILTKSLSGGECFFPPIEDLSALDGNDPSAAESLRRELAEADMADDFCYGLGRDDCEGEPGRDRAFGRGCAWEEEDTLGNAENPIDLTISPELSGLPPPRPVTPSGAPGEQRGGEGWGDADTVPYDVDDADVGTMRCRACGEEIRGDYLFCSECGAPA